MEESEKRRERLRAMRMEATQVDAAGTGDEPALPSYFCNPLIENAATTFSHTEECSTPRFDFYTDPMAAFSSSKRKSNDMPSCYGGFPASQIPSHCAGTTNPESTPPAPQFQRDHLQGSSHSCSSAPYGSPVRTARPFPMNQATPMARQCYQPNPVPTPGSGWNGSGIHGRSPPVGHSTSPVLNPTASPGLGSSNWRGRHTSPSNWRGRHTSPSAELDRGLTFAWAPRPSHSPSLWSGYQGSPNPSSHPGRGRCNWSGTHTSPGSGRWVGSHGHSLGIGKSSRAEGFYNESMLEDPWKFLEPVVWKNVNHSSKFRNLELKSVAPKRPRASESWSHAGSRPSLAEYLAASLNEAVDGAPSS